MKTLITMMMALLVTVLTGCSTRQGKIALSDDEIEQLSSNKNVTLSDALRKRLIANSQELKLTPEEMQVLKGTGKVILCGKCGYILNSLKYKKFKERKVEIDKNTGFAPDSIRSRILGPYVD